MSKSSDTENDKPLFSRHEHALEKTHEVCPECSAELVIKHGKKGAFFSCSSYPTCQFTRSVVEHERVDDTILPGSECPLCGEELAVKEGRYGMFIGCTNYPECKHIEGEQQHEELDVDCPSCQTGKLKEKTNRFGKTFYSCDQYPKCKYVINYPPVAEQCPDCHWSILITRHMAGGEMVMCPQKKCGYKRKAP